MMAQGILAGGQGIARGIEAVGNSAEASIKQYQQNKLMSGQAIGKFEAAMQEYGPELLKAAESNPDMAKAVKKLQKDGSLGLKDASQLAVFADTFGVAKQREAQAQRQVKELENDAIRANAAMLNALQTPGAGPTTAQKDTDAIIYSELASGQLKPDGVEARRADLLKQGGRDQERYDNAGTYVDRETSGNPVTAVKDRKTGQIGVVGEDGKFAVLDSKKFRPSTTSDADRWMSPEAFQKLSDTVVSQENEVKAVSKYFSGLKDLPTGIDKLTTTFSAAAKAVMGKPLNKEEQAMGAAAAYQQRLLGAIRTDILGPGVLTEIDAKRLIGAMGGDITSIFTNPEVVKAVLSDIISEKMNRYDHDLGIYNSHVAGAYGSVGYKQRKKLESALDMSAPAAPAQAPAAGGALVWNPATKSFTRQ